MEEADRPRTRIPWAKVGLVVLVLGAAHLGGYLLLTAQARKEKRGIEEARGAAALDAAVEPTPVGPGNPAAYREYRRAQDLWEDRKRRDELAGRISMFATWFGGAFAAEVVFGALGLLRVGTAARGGGVRRRGPSSARGP
jgi:hypothetical protein